LTLPIGKNMPFLAENIPKLSEEVWCRSLGIHDLRAKGLWKDVLLCLLMVGKRDTNDALCLKLEDARLRKKINSVATYGGDQRFFTKNMHTT